MGKDVEAVSPKLVAASIAVYNAMVEGMLPTPAKPHYTFNLRDLGKAFPGQLQADQRVGGAPDFVAPRFNDRIVSGEDCAWFN